jgi:hypothetical protein
MARTVRNPKLDSRSARAKLAPGCALGYRKGDKGRGAARQDRPRHEKHYGHLATSYVREAIRAAKPLRIGEAPKVVPLVGAR